MSRALLYLRLLRSHNFTSSLNNVRIFSILEFSEFQNVFHFKDFWNFRTFVINRSRLSFSILVQCLCTLSYSTLSPFLVFLLSSDVPIIFWCPYYFLIFLLFSNASIIFWCFYYFLVFLSFSNVSIIF